MRILISVASAALISTNAGRVASTIVTSREVMISHMLENALFRSKGGQVPKAGIQLDQVKSRDFIRETTAVLLENAVYFDAESFSAAKVPQETLAAQMKTAQTRLKKDATWSRLQVEAPELRSILEKKLRAKEFVKFKIESASLPITDKEAEEYFKANRLKFENLPFENFKTNIKSLLTKQQVDKRLKDWFELLETKYHVRNYLAE